MTSGGARANAGRKPGSPNHVPGPGRLPRSWRLALGDRLIVHQETAGGSTAQELGEVIGITRTKLTIRAGGIDYVMVR